MLVAAAACLAWSELRVAEYGDLYWQIPEGVRVLAGSIPNAIPYAIAAGPWLDHEWLFEAFVAWCYGHGAYALFVALFDVAYALFPIGLYVLLRRNGASELAAGALALLAFGELPSTSPYRPQTIGLYCFALVLFELGRDRPRLVVLALAELLWANVHASALLGPLLGAFALIGAAAERAKRPRLRALGIAFATLAVATLVTPHVFALWSYGFSTLAGAPFEAYVDEWRPLAFGDPDAWLVFVPAMALYAVLPRSRERRSRPYDLLAFGAFALLALDHRRSMAFLAPAAAPLLARAIDGALANRAALSERTLRATLVLARVAAAVSVVLLVVLGTRKLGAGNALLGPRAVDVATLARETNVAGNVYVWRPLAAYVPFAGYSSAKLLVDTHADPYSADTWFDADSLESLRPGFRDVLARNGLREVMIPQARPLAQVLPLVPGWHLAGTSQDLEAFVRE